MAGRWLACPAPVAIAFGFGLNDPIIASQVADQCEPGPDHVHGIRVGHVVHQMGGHIPAMTAVAALVRFMPWSTPVAACCRVRQSVVDG